MPITIFISRRFRLTYSSLSKSRSSSSKTSERKAILEQAFHITDLQLHPIKIFIESQILTRSRYLIISSAYHYLRFKEISINIPVVIIFKQQQQKTILKQAIHITNLQLHPIEIFAESQLLTRIRYLRISSAYHYLRFN